MAPFIKKLATYTEKNYWTGQLAIELRTKEEIISNDIQLSKGELEINKNTQDKIQPTIATDLLSDTLLSLIMKDPVLFKDDLKNINPELLDDQTAEAIVTLTSINSNNVADLLKDFRDKNHSYKLEFAYLKSQEFWKDSKDEELKTEFTNLMHKLEERHLRIKLEKIGFEMRTGDNKTNQLALASEANKVLNRLGIQKK